MTTELNALILEQFHHIFEKLQDCMIAFRSKKSILKDILVNFVLIKNKNPVVFEQI